MTLAQSIAADRQRLGLSQQDLARRLGVSQQSVSKWEDGRATPRGRRLSSLVDAFGKKSLTAAQVAVMLQPDINMTGQRMGQQAPPATPADIALHTLAQAAQDLARAAQAIAASVERLAQRTPPPSDH